jgi:hypothetical protein
MKLPSTDICSPSIRPARHALLYDALKQLLKQVRFLKAAMPVFRERRVMRNLLIEP